ncbi:nucleotide sugar dehydrogenase [Actinophytocola oryzae]|uniref:Nucleotide sugar dehydrogenase n=1 Tax=Actinophytocola oryzae TaxID=502181 RepID=A0A4R7W658_9PSEU|nr:nucleotide sugar dehydrogenase [Actinophytocola oryzae]TDV57499.1 nucleotide sugar dehydrogenase [Actinophytocola oryzae]
MRGKLLGLSPATRFDVVVVGVGHVGLPLARQADTAGLTVAGLDVRDTVVDGLAEGRSHVAEVSDLDVKLMLSNGFHPTIDPRILNEADVVVICVPTGLDASGTPDLGAVRAATATVAANLRPNALVVLESTTYPGTTDEVVRPILERATGWTAGDEFHLAYSAERVDPGNRRFGVKNTPKIISGHTPLCAKQCAAFYGQFVDSLVVARGTREAELAKVLENSYRYVNIALVNEVAMFCDRLGIDVWDVLYCAGTKPFGIAPFVPGPGVGGHSIPVDARYLASKAEAEGFSFGLLDAAHAVNAGMPVYVVDRAAALLSHYGVPVRGARVLLLGATYKPNVSDTRDSPAAGVAEGLSRLGAEVRYHDPYPVTLPGVARVAELWPSVAAADLTILLQDHREYDLGHLARSARLLFDTRGECFGERVHRL